MARRVPIVLYVEAETHARLEEIRKETGLTTAEFLRRIVGQGLDLYNKTKVIPPLVNKEDKACQKS